MKKALVIVPLVLASIAARPAAAQADGTCSLSPGASAAPADLKAVADGLRGLKGDVDLTRTADAVEALSTVGVVPAAGASAQDTRARTAMVARDAPEALAAAAAELADLAGSETDSKKQAALAAAARILAKAAAQVAPPAENRIEVKTEPIMLEVRLGNPPPTRLRLALSGDEGSYRELEWDPAVTTPLVQRVALPVGKWTVSASVETTNIQQGSDSIVIVTRFTELAGGAPFVMIGTPTALVAPSRLAGEARQVVMTGWPQPRLTLECKATPALGIDDVELAPQAPRPARSAAWASRRRSSPTRCRCSPRSPSSEPRRGRWRW